MAPVVAVIGGAGLLSDPANAATLRTLVAVGDVTAEGKTITEMRNPSELSDSGDVAILAALNGAFGDQDYDQIIYKTSASGLVPIARREQAVPSLGKIIPGFVHSQHRHVMSPAGYVYFRAELLPGLPGPMIDSAVFRGNGGPLEVLAHRFDPIPGTSDILPDTGIPFVNRADEFLFVGGGPNGVSSVVLGDGTSFKQLLRSGQPLPNGNGSFGPNMISIDFSDRGTFFLHNSFSLGGGRGLFLASELGVEEIARAGQVIPGVGTIRHFPVTTGGTHVAILNEADDVAFSVTLDNSPGGAATDVALLRYRDGVVSKLMQKGDPFPGGNGVYDQFIGRSADSSGRFFVDAILNGTSGGVNDNKVKMILSDSAPQIVVRAGQAVPGGNGFFLQPGLGSVNDLGQWAFMSYLSGTPRGEVDDHGIYLYDQGNLIEIARKGQMIGDRTIETFYNSGVLSINNRGQVAIEALLDNGNHAILLWGVPEPSTLPMLAAGALALAAPRLRRRPSPALAASDI